MYDHSCKPYISEIKAQYLLTCYTFVEKCVIENLPMPQSYNGSCSAIINREGGKWSNLLRHEAAIRSFFSWPIGQKQPSNLGYIVFNNSNGLIWQNMHHELMQTLNTERIQKCCFCKTNISTVFVSALHFSCMCNVEGVEKSPVLQGEYLVQLQESFHSFSLLFAIYKLSLWNPLSHIR